MTDPLPSLDELRRRIDDLRRRIAAAGADPAAVTVLAVTKGQPVEAVALAIAAGLGAVGENYAQELVAKAAAIAEGAVTLPGLGGPTAAPRWHAIGRLQRNKVRLLAPYVSCWQSIDRIELIDELARRAPGAELLVQVDTTGEPTKGGCPPALVPELVERASAAGLDVAGLMTVGPTHGDPTAGFVAVRSLVDRLGLRCCSMGMTDDLEAAVRAGSTMIRVGTALFGPRRPRPAVEH